MSRKYPSRNVYYHKNFRINRADKSGELATNWIIKFQAYDNVGNEIPRASAMLSRRMLRHNKFSNWQVSYDKSSETEYIESYPKFKAIECAMKELALYSR
jgi:hypothetical protein